MQLWSADDGDHSIDPTSLGIKTVAPQDNSYRVPFDTSSNTAFPARIIQTVSTPVRVVVHGRVTVKRSNRTQSVSSNASPEIPSPTRANGVETIGATGPCCQSMAFSPHSRCSGRDRPEGSRRFQSNSRNVASLGC